MTSPNQLTIRDIVLTKINRILNPNYVNKFIYTVLAVGVTLIAKNQIISLLYSFELLTEKFYIKAQLTDSNNTLFFYAGIGLILIACYFFYETHITKDPIIKKKYRNMKSASKRLAILLDENKRVFNESLSGYSASDITDINHDLTSREYVKNNILMPNNEKIYSILQNIDNLSRIERLAVDKMKSHIEHFKAHVNGEICDYTDHQFPIEFETLINSFRKVSRRQQKTIDTFSTWLREISAYNEVEHIYIYGSFLFSENASDIDIMIKTSYTHHQELIDNRLKWKELRNKIEHEFALKAHIKIFCNLDVGTYEEFLNKQNFKHKVL